MTILAICTHCLATMILCVLYQGYLGLFIFIHITNFCRSIYCTCTIITAACILFTSFLRSISMFLRSFFWKMVSIQKPFLIKNRLWWRIYCIWIIRVNLRYIPLVCKMLKMRKLQTMQRFCAHTKKHKKESEGSLETFSHC